MKIGEAAKKAGISPSNIRFYEKKGLLEPRREESSSYRDYTEEDVKRLKRILIFRKADLSVEKVGQLLEGKADPAAVLKEQEELLEGRLKELEGSLMLCRKLESEADILEADPEEFLAFIRNKESEGKQFSRAEEFLDGLSEYVGETYGGAGWFTAVFGSRAGIIKLLLGAGLWVFFLSAAAVHILEKPFSPFQAVFWGMLFLFYNVNLCRYCFQRK